MEIGTRRYFSVIVGEGCNARCPFCVAPAAMKQASEPLPLDRLEAAMAVARKAGAQVGSVSGGGEPLMLALRDPARHVELTRMLREVFAKRDLHSNYSFDLSRRLPLFPDFTHVTVSLWPDAQTNRSYMGYSRWEKTVALVRRDSDKANFRLSAVLGRDWVKRPQDIYNYLSWARQLGAQSVTLRTLQPSPAAGAQDWIQPRFLDGREVEEWIAQRADAERTTLRGLGVYQLEGVEVCCYRYGHETEAGEDREFLFFRPHTQSGRYGLFTDYDDDSCEVSL